MIQAEALRALEFDKVLAAVRGHAMGEPSRTAVMSLAPYSGKSHIEKRQGLVEEIRRLGSGGRNPLGLESFGDLGSVFEKIRPAGAILEPTEFLALAPVLGMITAIPGRVREASQMPGQTKYFPLLAGFTAGLADQHEGPPEASFQTGIYKRLLSRIRRSFDPEGGVLDGASSALAGLRQKIRGLDSKIGKRLEDLARDRGTAVFLQDGFISQRSGRWVLPVRMDSKGQVPGVVHDVSRSGETAFIEPVEIISLSNESENLRAEEKAEVIRVLRELSELFRENALELEPRYRILIELDVLNAIASFSDSISAERPCLNESGRLKISSGRHPLLLLARPADAAAPAREVVPLDLMLGEAQDGGRRQVMVITGPNAGGKTIAMKTAGLLSAMALAGMPVCARADSDFPVLDGILLDIGDEQSIEDNLSTFAAHVAGISRIVSGAGTKSLVLMDELGTGTDPAQGAAIANAVLETLKDKGALVIATTHLLDIIGHVQQSPGMVNASMDFDQRTMTPLFRLKTGEPGQSRALEIAARYGMPTEVLSRAAALLGSVKSEFHELVKSLKDTREEYERMNVQAREIRASLEAKEAQLRQQIAKAEKEKKEMLQKALEEARAAALDAKRHVNAILEEEKKARQAQKGQGTKIAAKGLAGMISSLDRRLRELQPERAQSINPEELKTGDRVFVPSFGMEGTVARIDRKSGKARIEAGGLAFDASISELEANLAGTGLPRVKPGVEISKSEEAVTTRINLLGKRVEEALELVEPFLNDASMAGISEAVIIHGIGTGALMRAVRDYLKTHPLVGSFRSGGQGEGGAGVTIVQLK